jgi:4-hydroxyphenylpyruvate dioxygenase-like putative hemolysin
MNAPLRAAKPMRTDGFEFVEYAATDPELLDTPRHLLL